MGEDWQMPRRGEMCDMCRRSFDPGETIQAYLYESPEGYQRRDYCAGCQPPDAAFAVGSWKTRRREPAAPKAPAFDREETYRLFEQLHDVDAPQQCRLRFVLGLLLWRKKVLRFDRSETRDGIETWHYTVPRTGDHHTVARPELDEQQLEQLGAQLERLLSGDTGDLSSLASDPKEDRSEITQSGMAAP